MIRESVLSAIGNTPLVRLRKLAPEGGAQVLVKLEFYNPTGSYKDRMALAMIEGAEARGALGPGTRVVEFTGGSTGSSLAMVCAAKGYAFVVLSSDAFAREKLQTMAAVGAAEGRWVCGCGLGKASAARAARGRSWSGELGAARPAGGAGGPRGGARAECGRSARRADEQSFFAGKAPREEGLLGALP